MRLTTFQCFLVYIPPNIGNKMNNLWHYCTISGFFSLITVCILYGSSTSSKGSTQMKIVDIEIHTRILHEVEQISLKNKLYSSYTNNQYPPGRAIYAINYTRSWFAWNRPFFIISQEINVTSRLHNSANNSNFAIRKTIFNCKFSIY